MHIMLETWPQIRARHEEERDALIVQMIRETGGNSHEAARRLNMNISYMRARVAKHRLRDKL